MDGLKQTTRTPRPEPPSSRAAGMLWFFVFTTAGLAAVAAGTLLPEYAALAAVEARRDALARQVACERKLAAYNDRVIAALADDPVLAARMLIRYANYSPAGCEIVDVGPSCRVDPTPARILREAATPPPRPPDPLLAAARWLEHAPTRLSLIALGLGTLAMGVLLFAGRGGNGPDETV